RFVADLSLFLPAAPTAEQRLLVDQLRDGALSRVLLMGIEGADAPVRARLSRALADALRSDERFASIANGVTRGFERERELLFTHRYALSPKVDSRRFGVEGLREAVGETLELLASPAGLLAKPLVPRDPTGEMLAVIEQMRPAEGPRMIEGVWASLDGNRALLVARTRAGGADIDAQAAAMEAAQAAFERAQPGAARLVMTGPGAFAVRSRALIKHDVERLAIVSLVLVAAILISVYRSPRVLALGLVPVASGALAGVAAVSLGFGAVHGITLGFGTTLIGEAVDYSIYYFVQSDELGSDRFDPNSSFWPTVRLGVLTSIAGFSALLFSGLPGLAQLGLFSIVGLVVAAAVTRFVLPALLPARLRIRDLTPLGLALQATCAQLAHARLVVPILVIAATLVLVSHHGAWWDRDLANLNPIAARDRLLDAQLRAGLAASDARHLVVIRGDDREQALAGAERVGMSLDAVVAAKRLGGYESPARWLPSAAMQRARLAVLPEPDELRRRLRAALSGMPLRPERLEPFVADVAQARTAQPLAPEQVSGTALASALEGLLLRGSDGRWNAIVGLRAPEGGTLDLDATRVAIMASGVPGAVLLDLKSEADRLYSGYFERALLMSAVGLAIIVVLLAYVLRDPMRVARVLAPLAAAVLVTAAWHLITGTRLTLLHLVGLLLVVAIGSNYALFFDRLANDRGDSAPRTLASLAVANLTTVAGFGVLAASSIPLLAAVGSTVALGAFTALAFAAMLTPAALQFRARE
ncbi:MAG TPA: MMPL family transporter, partial [Usitatibacter sp.]|nr:MMPL family transporter [Usitatibacter sp.]